MSETNVLCFNSLDALFLLWTHLYSRKIIKLYQLFDESRQMGLTMNIAKTKTMVVDNTPINVNNKLIEQSGD